MATRQNAARSRRQILAEKAEKELEAVAFHDETFRQLGRQPTFRETAELVGRNPATVQGWNLVNDCRRRLRVKSAPKNRRRYSKEKEDRAIAYQTEIQKASGKLALLRDVARHVRVHWGTLKHWPRFMAARRGIEAAMGLKAGCGNRGRHPTGKEDQAIAYQAEVYRTKQRKVTMRQVEKRTGVARCVPYHWLRFMTARRKLDAENAIQDRGGWPKGKEDKAIAYQDEMFRKSGRLLKLKEVAEYCHVTVTTVCNWRRLAVARGEIIKKLGLAVNQTQWGRPRDFREAEAIIRLQEAFDATGRVPPVDAFAESIGVGKQVLNAWTVFRAAYRCLWGQQRPEGGSTSADGNGAAGNGRAIVAAAHGAAPQADADSREKTGRKVDTKVDTRENSQNFSSPASGLIIALCTRLKRQPAKQRRWGWMLDVAREFVADTGRGNAENLLRQANRYPYLWR